MTEAVERQLRETLQTQASELRKLKERGARLDAADVISEYFTTIRVGEAVQKEVAKTLLERVIPMTSAGDLDKEALKKLAEAETVRELEFIERATGHKIVRNLGTFERGAFEERAARSREETAEAHSNNLAMLIGVPGERGRQIMREGRAAFDPMYNAGERNNGKLTVGTEANITCATPLSS